MDPETDVDGAINLSTHQQAEPQPILSDQPTTSSPTLNHNVSFLTFIFHSMQSRENELVMRQTAPNKHIAS